MSSSSKNISLRNIAIIAHVDHGKTTLVNAMYKQGSSLRDSFTLEDRVMDSMDLEKERGITIAAKNCAVNWDGVKINIIDTPGHADFGGEVERAMSMVDGAVLLVDSSEGPLPQTRFVLKKALDQGLKVIVAINKIDRKDARVNEVIDEIIDLFIDLDATEDQLDFPVLYCIGKEGIARYDQSDTNTNLEPLFNTIIKTVPAPKIGDSQDFSMLISDLGYSDYLGRLAVGKIYSGSISTGSNIFMSRAGTTPVQKKIGKIQVYNGLQLEDIDKASAGEIVILSGMEDSFIGDTFYTGSVPTDFKTITVDEPTVSMRFSANTSPLAGKEGTILQSARIKERLLKETLRNVAIQVEDGEGDSFIVKGRGEFQLAILIETMRREGFELCVGRPEVICKIDNGKKMEPMELVYIDCDEAFIGIVTEKLAVRKGVMVNLVNKGSGRVRAEFTIPSRGLIGYMDTFMSDTRGTGLINTLFTGYEEYKGDFPARYTGSLVSDRSGVSVAYGLFHLEPRGNLLIKAGEQVYEGMVIGEHSKGSDLDVNPCKEKKLSNMRAAGKDENIILKPIKPITLEEAINFLNDDEMVEVTPKSIRIRKRVLSSLARHKAR